MPDITILNLNMLYLRCGDKVERQNHLVAGPLYVVSALEKAGYKMDFRDYQLCQNDDLFSPESICEALHDPAPVVGVSCMANLLPFAILSLREFKCKHPEVTVMLGGVGTKMVEREILESFPWIDIIVRGEAETIAPRLLNTLRDKGAGLTDVPGISFRDTAIYRELMDAGRRLEFCPALFPEYMVTGHENTAGVRATVDSEHTHIFELIKEHPDIFPGFFHFDIEGNLLPKLKMLEDFGFYRKPGEKNDAESCGAHSPQVEKSQSR